MNAYKRQSKVSEYCVGYLYSLFLTVTLKILFPNTYKN